MAKSLLEYAKIVPFGETKLLVSSLLRVLAKHTPQIFMHCLPELLAWVDSSLSYLSEAASGGTATATATASNTAQSKSIKANSARVDSARSALQVRFLISI